MIGRMAHAYSTRPPLVKRYRNLVPSRSFGSREPARTPVLRYERVALGDLDDTEFSDVFQQMGAVIQDATVGSGDSDWAAADWEARCSRVRRNTDAYLVWDGSTLVAFTLFAIFPYLDRTCVHMKAGYVRARYQHGGIGHSVSTRIFRRAVVRRPWSKFYMVSDVLNPVVAAGWIQRFPATARLAPAGLSRAVADMGELAAVVAADLYPWAEFDAEYGVLRNRTRPRTSAGTCSGIPWIDEYFRRHMCPQRGDTVLLVVDFDHSTLWRSMGELLRSSIRAFDRRLHLRSDG